jgi:hypothetical protein
MSKMSHTRDQDPYEQDPEREIDIRNADERDGGRARKRARYIAHAWWVGPDLFLALLTTCSATNASAERSNAMVNDLVDDVEI